MVSFALASAVLYPKQLWKLKLQVKLVEPRFTDGDSPHAFM